MFPILPGSAEAQVTQGGIVNCILIAYFIDITSPKKCQNYFTWVSYSKPKVGCFFETRCSCALFGGFAIGAWVWLLWQHSPNAKMSASALLALCLVVVVTKYLAYLTNTVCQQSAGIKLCTWNTLLIPYTLVKAALSIATRKHIIDRLTSI